MSHGRETELGTDLVIGLMFHIADTEEQAIREATPFFEEWMKMFAPLGFVPGLSDAQVQALADPQLARHTPLPTLQDAVNSGAWLVGPPEHIVERLQELQARYPGLDEVHVGQVVGTDQQVILEQLEWFAADVMPDKLHPNAHGYDLWYDAIAKPVADMMSDKPAAAPAKVKAKKKK